MSSLLNLMNFRAEKKFFFNVCFVSMLGQKWSKNWFRFLNPNFLTNIITQRLKYIHTQFQGSSCLNLARGKATRCTWLLYSVTEVHTGYCGSINEVMVPGWRILESEFTR